MVDEALVGSSELEEAICARQRENEKADRVATLRFLRIGFLKEYGTWGSNAFGLLPKDIVNLTPHARIELAGRIQKLQRTWFPKRYARYYRELEGKGLLTEILSGDLVQDELIYDYDPPY